MSTPILPLAVWQSGSNQARIPANDNSLRLEALSREIISQAVTAQPGSPSDGDTYIIAATHTGSQWAGFDPKDIAIYRSGTWYAFAPVEGLIVNIAGTEYKYDGGAWTATTGGGASTTQTGEFLSGYIATVSDKTYKIVVKAAHGGTITETTTISESGTCTATFKINTTALGGTANSVSASEQSQSHSSANAFSAGDDIQITVSSNSSCVGFSFSIKYTRTLA